MGGKASIFLCFLIVIMDVTAGILGIEAEIAQNKVTSNLSFYIALKKIYAYVCN